jgi:hypothetical protein
VREPPEEPPRRGEKREIDPEDEDIEIRNHDSIASMEPKMRPRRLRF